MQSKHQNKKVNSKELTEKGSYKKKLIINGTFLDVLKVAAKDANNKSIKVVGK